MLEQSYMKSFILAGRDTIYETAFSANETDDSSQSASDMRSAYDDYAVDYTIDEHKERVLT
ncbi:unnamed protein product [Orchesella dallaii]|uniref:Uncharacterized protein n=1 Tax=Orchesella dallaii TaxID=48710 RepID=A0ABP1PTV8_9HEXA